MRTSLPLHTFIRAAEEANDTPSLNCHIDPPKSQRCSLDFIFSIIGWCLGWSRGRLGGQILGLLSFSIVVHYQSFHQWKVDAMTDIHLARNVITRPIRGHHNGDQSAALIGSISTNWMRELSYCQPVTSTCLLFVLQWYLAMRRSARHLIPWPAWVRRRTFQPSISTLTVNIPPLGQVRRLHTLLPKDQE